MNRAPNAHPNRPATTDELRRDVESVVQQLGSAWENEVDVIVILSPRNSGQLAMSSNASRWGSLCFLFLCSFDVI